MIKANELRIGNYVTLFDVKEWAKIHLVCKTAVQVEGNLIGGDTYGLKDVYPIPLTPEILEKAGFKKVHTELEPVAFTYSLEIPVDGDNKNEIHFTVVKMGNSESHGNYLVNDHWASNNFKYLHQLQNLYLDLTGEELTVNFKDLTYQ